MAHNWRKKNYNRPHLIIMRGLPGSGKSQLAREIKQDDYNNRGVILSSDDYFRNEYGVMEDFHWTALNDAHEWNRERAEDAMSRRKHPIIIDNTNMRVWEVEPYVRMGLDYGYYIKFEETADTWDVSVEELHRRTGGKVPLWKMKRMKMEYDPIRSIYDVIY